MKVVEENTETNQVNAINPPNKRGPCAGRGKDGFGFQSTQEKNSATTKECGNCGKTHDLRRRESCPAFRRTCAKCGKYNHFAAVCRSSALVDGNAHRQTARSWSSTKPKKPSVTTYMASQISLQYSWTILSW